MKVLARVRDGFAHHLAGAVVIAPGRMQSYLAYSIIATDDPHSDYAVQMEYVCRKASKALTSTLARLADGDRQFITERLLNPRACVALRLPESER